jgi:phage/plasmid-like protein (TIGR03299 family)
MSHHFEEGTGMFVRKPSWHGLEKAVLPEYVHTWEEARVAAGMEWEVETGPVALPRKGGSHLLPPVYDDAEDYRAIYRTDKSGIKGLLAIQPITYKVIDMASTGEVIQALLGDEEISYEALFSLYGGRQIWSVLYFEEPLVIPADPSQTFSYLGIGNRFDGQGGLRALPTNVRIQCANTVNHAEAIDGRRVGMTLRHTKNWENRVSEVAAVLADARKTATEWAEISNTLAAVHVTPRQTDRFVEAFLPKRDDMTDRQDNNTEDRRVELRSILASPTCDHIRTTAYGLAQAGIEYVDHGRRIVTESGYVNRQLGGKENLKARAIRTAKIVAGVHR